MREKRGGLPGGDRARARLKESSPTAICLACLAAAHDPYRARLARICTGRCIVLRPTRISPVAAEVMRARRIKRLPIAQNGKLLGIVSLSDLAAIAGGEAEQIARRVRQFFTAVVRTKPSQSEPSREASIDSPRGIAPAEFANEDHGKFSTPVALDRLPNPR